MSNEIAEGELSRLLVSFTMRDWMLSRTRLDMSREEIMEDEMALLVMAAWKKAGSKPGDFDAYLDKGQGELMEELGFDVDEALKEAEESDEG